jgi:hypothetical protein
LNPPLSMPQHSYCLRLQRSSIPRFGLALPFGAN